MHHGVADTLHKRQVNYRDLVNPLIRQPAFSDDRLEAIHQTALRVVEELGIKVLNDEARSYFLRAVRRPPALLHLVSGQAAR